MGRWQPDSRGRLQEAALALYSERGFDQTTAAQIAERAGLTERTFFRHFADKREVLFGGSALLKDRIVNGVAGAPATDGPLDAVSAGLDAAAAMLGESRRDLDTPTSGRVGCQPGTARARTRQTGGLRRRRSPPRCISAGSREPQATLAAESGMTVLRVAMQTWATGDDDRELRAIMRDAVAELRAVTASG